MQSRIRDIFIEAVSNGGAHTDELLLYHAFEVQGTGGRTNDV